MRIVSAHSKMPWSSSGRRREKGIVSLRSPVAGAWGGHVRRPRRGRAATAAPAASAASLAGWKHCESPRSPSGRQLDRTRAGNSRSSSTPDELQVHAVRSSPTVPHPVDHRAGQERQPGRRSLGFKTLTDYVNMVSPPPNRRTRAAPTSVRSSAGTPTGSRTAPFKLNGNTYTLPDQQRGEHPPRRVRRLRQPRLGVHGVHSQRQRPAWRSRSSAPTVTRARPTWAVYVQLPDPCQPATPAPLRL